MPWFYRNSHLFLIWENRFYHFRLLIVWGFDPWVGYRQCYWPGYLPLNSLFGINCGHPVSTTATIIDYSPGHHYHGLYPRHLPATIIASLRFPVRVCVSSLNNMSFRLNLSQRYRLVLINSSIELSSTLMELYSNLCNRFDPDPISDFSSCFWFC